MHKSSRAFPRNHSHTRVLLAAAFLAALASGCGGGGGNLPDSYSDKATGGDGAIWLSWRAPSERENGESLPLSDISGYRIYWGPSENPTQYSVDVGDPSTTTYTIDGIPPGSYDVAVTAVDTAGLESYLSNVMNKSVN